MKKITLTSFAVVALGTILFALPASAATTASIAPANIKVAGGQQFNVVVSVNPNGTSNFAEQLQVKYPADLLQVTSFSIGSNWMSLTQPGYDSVDNTNGVMVKTAGYAGGITSQTPFGTITFTAKKSGSGTIEIGSGSQAFEKAGQTAITGTGTSFVVTTATVVPTVTPKKTPVTAEPTPVANDLTPVTTVNGEVVATTTAQEVAAAVAASQVAAVSVAAPSGSGSIWIWILVIIVVIIVLYVIFKRKK